MSISELSRAFPFDTQHTYRKLTLRLQQQFKLNLRKSNLSNLSALRRFYNTMTVRHIVLFKVRKDVTKENLQKWIHDIVVLKQTCQGVLSLSLEPQTAVYENYGDRSAGFNYILDGTYTDGAALSAYNDHPDHRAAQKFSAEHIRDTSDPLTVIAVDYVAKL